MQFRPLHDRVVVKRIDAESKTTGGIIIPTLQKKNLKPARSRLSVQAAAMKRANSSRLILRSETRCCSENGPARRSSLTALSS